MGQSKHITPTVKNGIDRNVICIDKYHFLTYKGYAENRWRAYTGFKDDNEVLVGKFGLPGGFRWLLTNCVVILPLLIVFLLTGYKLMI